MIYPDVVTNVHHKLPMINVVFTDLEYVFTKSKYENTNKNLFGIDSADVDYAQISEAQGAKGFTVSRIEDIDRVMRETVVASKTGHTMAMDCKITTGRPIPVEALKLNPELFSESEISAYHEKYEVQYLVPFRELLEAEGLKSQYIK